MSAGFVSVPVVPTFEGMTKAFAERLEEPAKQSGERAAKYISDGLGGAVASLEKQAKASQKKLQDLDNAYEKARAKKQEQTSKLEGATLRLKDAEDKYQKAIESGGNGLRELAKVKDEKARVTKATEDLRQAEIDVRVAEEKHNNQLKDLNRTLGKLGDAQRDAANDADHLEDKIEDASKATGRFKDNADKVAGSMRGGMGMGAVAGVFASITSSITNSIGGIASEALTASDATDKFKATLDFAGMDTSAIEQATKQAQDYADKTVYGLSDIQSMTAQLAANGVKDYVGLTEAAGNLNAVAGGNADTFKSVGMVLSQTAGAGKLTTENWNQLANAIPGASGKLQEAMLQAGAYTGNFRDAMAEGQITAEEFNAAISTLGNEPVAAAAATSTETFEGMLGDLNATITGETTKAFDELKPLIGDVFTWISGAVETTLPKLVDLVGQTAEKLETAATWVKDNQVWLGPLAVAVTAAAAAYTTMTTAMTLAKGASDLLKAAMAVNPATAWIVGITALVAGLTWFFTQTETGRELWENFTDAIGAGMDWIGEKWDQLSGWLNDTWLWIQANVIQGFQDGINGLWANVVSPVIDWIGDKWDWLGGRLQAGWLWVDANVFGPLRGGLDTLQGWFQAALDGIARIWDRLKEKTATPINWVIDVAYNNGIKRVWDGVAGLLGMEDKKLPEIPKLAFATGGVLPGPATPGRDIHRFVSPTGGILMLSGREAVMRPEWTEAMGDDYVHQMNAIARRGGAAAVRRAMAQSAQHFAEGGVIRRFANGGVIDSIVGLVNRFFPGMTVTSTLRAGDPGYHGRGMAVDFSDGTDTTPGMQSAARFFHKEYGAGLAELIHYPLNGWVNIKNGAPLDYGEPTNSQHRNHVHVASQAALPAPENAGEWLAKIGETIKNAGSGAVNWARGRVADMVAKLLDPIGKALPNLGPGALGEVPAKFFDKVVGDFVGFIKGKADTRQGAGSFDGQGGTAGNAESWRAMAMEAMRRNGFNADDPAQVNAMLAQIQSESGGNPGIAQQIVDVNGTGESAGVGLLQIIPGTFAAHRDPTLPDDRRDPWANMNAALRYYRSRYGTDLTTMWGHGHGYSDGGILDWLRPKLFDQGGWLGHMKAAVNLSGKPEPVLTNAQWADVSSLIRVVGQLIPAINDQVEVLAVQAESMQSFLAKAGEYGSVEGIAARQTLRGVLDLGLDLPGQDLITAFLDGEEAIWSARTRQLDHLDNIAAAEEALAEARKELAELESEQGEMTKEERRKLTDAEKELAEARGESVPKSVVEAEKKLTQAREDGDAGKIADAEANLADARRESGEKSAEKIADAEQKLARVREDIADNREKNEAKRAEDIIKAKDKVTKAEGDLSKARKAQAMDLDNITVLSQASISSLIPMAEGLAGQLVSMGASSGAVSAGLSAVTGALGSAAAMAGPAGISLGVVLEGAKVVLDIGKQIWDLAMKIREAIWAGRKAAVEAMAAQFDVLGQWLDVVAKQQAEVSKLQQSLVRGLIDMRTAEFNLRVAQRDRVIAEAESAVKVAQARLALDEEIRKGAVAAQLKLMGLHEDWDSYLSYLAQNSQGVLAEWSDAAISALYEYESARAQALKGELVARRDMIKAEAAVAEAHRANARNQQDLLRAQERLIQMSADAFGVDQKGATIGSEIARVQEEIVKMQEWYNRPFNRVRNLGGDAIRIGSKWDKAYDAYWEKMNALQENLAKLQALAGAPDISSGALAAHSQLAGDLARSGSDALEYIGSPTTNAQLAFDWMKFQEKLNSFEDSRLDVERQVEDLNAEVALYEKVSPLEETIKGLDYAIRELDNSAQAWADGNEELRGEYLAAARANRGAAGEFGISWQLDQSVATPGVRRQIEKEVTVHMDGEKMYTADQVDELLRQVTADSSVSYTWDRSASKVATARRKERI